MLSFDIELIRKLKHQDHAAFNEFYLKTVDVFFRYIEANYFLDHKDAEDLIADFYIKFWDSVKKFDETMSFSWYFWTIFKNLIKDHFKKNNDIPFTELERDDQDTHFEETLIDEENIHDLLHQNFQFEQIQKAMKELDDVSKDIIYWKFIEEKNNEEIEFILGISNDNLRQKSSRAIKQLKKLLEDNL